VAFDLHVDLAQAMVETQTGEARGAEDIFVLERGRIAFAYRPRVEHQPGIQRFYSLLSPEAGTVHRRILIGKKRLPDVAAREREWAVVERIAAHRATLYDDLGPKSYVTKTRGERHQPGVRHVADGAYAIVRHGEHAHLVYRLVGTEEHTDLHDALGLRPEASFIAAVFNPLRETGARAADVGPFSEPSIYPDDLQDIFRGRRFAPLEPALIDHAGAEIVLIGARDDVGVEAGLRLADIGGHG
jgi:hypothetical protein